MDELTATRITLIISSWFFLTGGIWKLFERVEKAASAEAKQLTSNWLCSVDLRGISHWPASFCAAFDAVFGNRHLSVKCFRMSSIASILAVVIITFVWGAIRPEEFERLLRTSSRFENVYMILFLSLVLNVLPDYLSLLETRFVLRWLPDSPSLRIQMALVGFDIVCTALIGIAAWLLFDLFTNYSREYGTFEYLALFIFPMKSDLQGFSSPGIWFYSTFFTSIWIWLYILAGFMAYLGRKMGFVVDVTRRLLDVKNKPFITLGMLSIVIITACYCLAFLGIILFL
ncbi:MAG: hypothetical protein O7G85_16885 [Planctomycetota bacterium]|nr:hypothetical protein [Planctomycetota bacterium]